MSTAKWSTFAEGSDFCWGSISTYEYLLPNNWSIGANVSNGSSWIGGGSSVTVTSDLSTGNGMTIKVRPANNCGSSLQNGIPPAEILISRPKPLLTFTGGYAVCTSQNFQANSVPGWVSNYTWLVTPNTVFGNSNPTSNPTTVTKIMDGEGDIQLTISSGSCPLSFVYNTMEITGHAKLVAGKPFIQSAQSLIIYGGPGDENELCRNEESIVEFTTGEGSTTTWTYVSHNGNPQPSWTPWGNDDVLVYFFKPTQNTLVLDMDASNTCGTTSYRFGFIAVDCEGLRAGKKNLFKISPNPAYDMISIVPIETLERKTETKFISEVTVSDFSNNVVNRKKFDKAQTAQLSIGSLKPGIYYITIVSEKYTETQKIIKK
ncbi:MAG: T9SS type A sorting domain-containing protein [Chitinophagaceae bacterium]